MKNLVLFGLLIMLLVAAQFASAQTVDEVIQKYIDARGGKDKLDSVKSIYMEGSREMMGNEVTVKVIKEKDKLSRTEFEMGSTNGFTLITDKEAWRFIPMRSQSPEKLSPEETAGMQTELDIEGPLVDYAAKGNKAELLGKDTLDGNPNFKIKLTTGAGKEITFWIDAQTYLLTQTSQKGAGIFGGGRRNGDNNNNASKAPGDLITIYKDYSPVNGIQFAHTIDIKMSNNNGRAGGSTTFDKIEINGPVDPKYYKPE